LFKFAFERETTAFVSDAYRIVPDPTGAIDPSTGAPDLMNFFHVKRMLPSAPQSLRHYHAH
jgi:hypothetical protein